VVGALKQIRRRAEAAAAGKEPAARSAQHMSNRTRAYVAANRRHESFAEAHFADTGPEPVRSLTACPGGGSVNLRRARAHIGYVGLTVLLRRIRGARAATSRCAAPALGRLPERGGRPPRGAPLRAPDPRICWVSLSLVHRTRELTIAAIRTGRNGITIGQRQTKYSKARTCSR
jgi:hypothetical protein